MMEFLVGITGDGFVLVAADRNGGRGIVRMKDGTCFKIVDLDFHLKY